MPGVDDPDAAAKVDQPVPVGIGDHRSFGVDHGDRGHRRHAPRDRLGPPGEKGAALGPGISVCSWMTARHHTSAWIAE